ncbi:hypothetical protein BC827DRAFT_323817 [Russula dissimulans]|nr:hypothetical protein BC827DRAFT_323817 [Russula dissimulans]
MDDDSVVYPRPQRLLHHVHYLPITSPTVYPPSPLQVVEVDYSVHKTSHTLDPSLNNDLQVNGQAQSSRHSIPYIGITSMTPVLGSMESDQGFINMNALSSMEREAESCSKYTCCGLDHQGLHGLIEHFEKSHIDPVGPSSQPSQRRALLFPDRRNENGRSTRSRSSSSSVGTIHSTQTLSYLHPLSKVTRRHLEIRLWSRCWPRI